MNEDITSRDVRLISSDGENVGIVKTTVAMSMAIEKGLDLVLISPDQDPPVAKILDYGKYKFEADKKAREAKKKQHTVDLKEIKMRYKIDTHDYEVRVKNSLKFLKAGNKVKVMITLKGREAQHSDLAFDLIRRFMDDLGEGNYIIDKKPSLEGRNVTLILAPVSGN